MGYIYKITNMINNKSYVGVTIQPDGLSRFKAHMSAIRSGKGCPLLQKAVNKYGEAAFTFQILIICFDEDVFKYEKEYIMKYNAMSPNGYNVAEGGKSGRNFLGKTHSEETKKILSEKSKEYGLRPEVKERSRQNMIKLNEKRKNGDISEKWKEAIKSGKMGGTCNKGRKVKEDVKKKISEGLKAYFNNKKISEDDIGRKKHSIAIRKARGRKVLQYSKENVLLASYDSIAEAVEKTQVHRCTIQSLCCGRLKVATKFIWKYAEPKEPLILVE
jgi:group I intron endonuclease